MAASRRSAKWCNWLRKLGPTCPKRPSSAWPRRFSLLSRREPGAAVREAIQQEVAKRLRIDPMVKEAMAEAFAVVLEEFRDVTLKDSAVLESVGRQVHGVTGGQMQDFAKRLRDAESPPLTIDLIIKWGESHRERTGDWPSLKSGVVFDAPAEKWHDIDVSLRQGFRSLPAGSSLAKLLGEYFGRRNKKNLPDLTEEQILTWAKVHHDRTGKWPTSSSGEIADAPGETWLNVSQALHQGLRRSQGRTLAQLLEQHFGVRNGAKNFPTFQKIKSLDGHKRTMSVREVGQHRNHARS